MGCRYKELPDESVLKEARKTPLDWELIYHKTLWIDNFRGFESERHFVIEEIKHEISLIKSLRKKKDLSLKEAISELERSGKIFGQNMVLIETPQVTNGLFNQKNYENLWDVVGLYVARTINETDLKPHNVLIKLSNFDSDLCKFLGFSHTNCFGIVDSTEKYLKDSRYFVSGSTYTPTAKGFECDMGIDFAYNITK